MEPVLFYFYILIAFALGVVVGRLSMAIHVAYLEKIRGKKAD